MKVHVSAKMMVGLVVSLTTLLFLAFIGRNAGIAANLKGVAIAFGLLVFIGLMVAAVVGITRAVGKKKITKKQVWIGVVVFAGLLLIIGGIWWWLSSPPGPSAPSTTATPAASSSSTWESPDLRQVMRAAQNHWVKVLVMWAILALIALIVSVVWEKYAKAWHGKVQWAMLGVVAFFLAIMPVWYWLESQSAQAPQQSKSGGPCLSSSKEARVCIVTAAGVDLSTEEKTSQGEFEFCYLIPAHARLEVEELGINTFRYRSSNGAFAMRHKMVRHSDLVGGKCPSVLS